MKGALIALGVVFTLIFGIVGWGAVMYYNAASTGNRMENTVEAKFQNAQQILAGYSQKVQEAAQVPGMAKDDLKEVMAAALSGRYGANGSQAVFQFITENYPGQVDSALYVNIQRIVEAGRNDFTNSQTALIDAKRAYKDELGSPIGGFFMRLAGFPRVDIDKTYIILLTDSVIDNYKRGAEEKPIKLR